VRSITATHFSQGPVYFRAQHNDNRRHLEKHQRTHQLRQPGIEARVIVHLQPSREQISQQNPQHDADHHARPHVLQAPLAGRKKEMIGKQLRAHGASNDHVADDKGHPALIRHPQQPRRPELCRQLGADDDSPRHGQQPQRAQQHKKHALEDAGGIRFRFFDAVRHVQRGP
jgi:hypothetical protein